MLLLSSSPTTMHSRLQHVLCGMFALVLAACGGSDAPTGSAVEAESNPAPATAADAPTSASARGTATISLEGDGVSVAGDFPAARCGGPYIMGEGVAYQTQAGDWQITIAAEQRQSGNVPLNASEDQVNVVVTANGPDRQFVRGPRNSGTLVISDDFRRAEADLELRPLLGEGTARLTATFVCE